VKTLTIPNGRKPKLVVFDVEGVLIPKNRLFFDVAKSLGIVPLMKVLFFGFLYQVGFMPLKAALSRIFRVIQGVKVEFLSETIEKLPLMPNGKEVFAALKAKGCQTALISSGLPTFLVESLASKLGADYAVGIEVGIKDNALTGEVWGDVTERNGKFLVLKELMDDKQLAAGDCVVVADDRNNGSLFLKEALKIGYNPDFVIRVKADVVVAGRLTKILPLIDGEAKKKSWPALNDLLREFIHGSGFFIPLLAIGFGIPIVALFIVAVVAFYSVSETVRVEGINMPFFSSITKRAASQSELCEFTLAPIYFAVGILLTLLLIPAPASYAGIAIFALGDSTASLFGGTLSKKPLPFNRAKTAEGTLAGLFFAFLAGSLFISPWIALAGAAVGMMVEYLPLPVNDNLLIPLCTGLALTLLI
jgi:HAD superfamily phosphoserine phosphatase-like hydrolase